MLELFRDGSTVVAGIVSGCADIVVSQSVHDSLFRPCHPVCGVCLCRAWRMVRTPGPLTLIHPRGHTLVFDLGIVGMHSKGLRTEPPQRFGLNAPVCA